MSSLSPETRALIDAAGDADRPTADERARLRAALVTRLGIGAAVATTTAALTNGAVAGGTGVTSTLGAASTGGGAGIGTAAVGAGGGALTAAGGGGTATAAGAAGIAGVTKATVAATTGLPLAMKIAGAAVVASAVALTGVAASTPDVPATSQATASQQAPSTRSSAAERVVPPPAPARVVDELPSVTDPAAAAAPEPLPTASASIATRGERRERQEPPPAAEKSAERVSAVPYEPAITTSEVPVEDAPSPSAGESTIAGETALLRRAHALLIGGNASGALGLLDEHARSFPNGILVEEREAERVAALCAAGRVERARAEATRFIAAHPGSPLTSRVRRTCETR